MRTASLHLHGYGFTFVGEICPETEPDGSIKEFMPQARYKNAETTRLNKHGQGPFCRFTFPTSQSTAGVYALTIDGHVHYVGETVNLSRRWGLGQFGSIQPKNCYVGGQSTNCKINARVLRHAKKGETLELWFHQTEDHKNLEAELIDLLDPPWNG